MTRYTPAPVSQHWDRWQQPHAGPDYSMMQVDSMGYDPRSVPSTAALQRPTIATQYAVATSYAESPVTPMASSPYGSQGHFSEYSPCTYQSPAVPSSSTFSQMPYRTSHRPLAPPTPPLDEERGMRTDAGRLNYTTGDTCQKSTRRSVTVKPEAKEESKEIKTIPKFVKMNGELQYESTRKFDLVLKLVEEKIPIKKEPQSGANTPESMGSPVASSLEEDQHKTGPPKPAKKHICPVEACRRPFGQKAQLVTHMRSHTGEKPYECDICGFRSTQPGNLKTHKKIHTPEKPFSCHVCGLTFKSKGSVKPHIQIKHDNRPKFNCPLHLVEKCRKDFTTIGNMKNHIEHHHKPEVQHYQKMLEEYDPEHGHIGEKDLQVFKTILEIYKNSNRGIKGRGVGKSEEKDKKTRDVDMKREGHQEMTPVSPDSNHAVQEYRPYYEQSHQSPYHVLPHPGQSHAGYMQLPLHTPPQHQPYHGLSQPSAYSMGWGPSPQYH